MDPQPDPGANGSPDGTPVIVRESGGDKTFNSIKQAARELVKIRDSEPPKPAEPTSAAPAAAEPPKESTAPAEDAAPPQEATGETQEADPASQPPLELPRSWSKERAESWAKLDRDTQQYLLDHDREASSTVRKAQNEAAEKLKGLTAKEQAAEQLRQQYEQALPLLFQNLQSVMSGEFSDIKSIDDVQRMAAEDWPRYIKWDAQQKRIAAVQQEMLTSQQRAQTEAAQKWTDFARKEDENFISKVPEFADKTKAAKMQDAAVTVLKDIGFTEEELGKSWNGQERFSLRDHRMQLLILDGIRYREAQQKAKEVVAKPVPPVQRPGVSQPKGAAVDAEIQALGKKLDNARNSNEGARLAAQILAARRRAAR